ncbi:hypothetical protein Tco_0304097 [Tanacetum coccineum]
MASAIICLATNQKFNFSKYIFDSMVNNVDNVNKFLMYSRFVQVFVNQQAGDMSNHKRIYVTPSHTKKVFGNMKREGKGFSGRKHTPKKPKKKDTQIPKSSVPSDNIAEEAINKENVRTHSNDPLLSGEDRLKLEELMALCTNLQNRVLDLEHTKTTQALEIDSLKRRVKKFEKKQRSRTHGLRRLHKVGLSVKVISSKDEGLGEEDASKYGRKIHDIDADEYITLENVHDADITIPVSATKDLSDVDMTLAQALAELKNAKPNTVTIAATTTTTTVTRPKAKGLAIQEQEQASTPITSSKDKGKGIMEARIAREKEEANAALIAQWNNIQDKVETDYELAQRLQAEEQEELTIEEKSKLFQQLLEKRRKHFAAKRAEERRNRPPTKAQQRSIMCTYLKNMARWKPKDLKTKSFANVQELFDKAMKRNLDEKVKAEVDDAKEAEELKQCLEVVPVDREDLEVLWRIVKARFKKTELVNYMDTFLHLNLKTMFEHHVEDMQTIPYYLLVEKMYSLTKHTLHQMFNNVKLQVDYECEMAYELLRLVKKQLKEGYVPE